MIRPTLMPLLNRNLIGCLLGLILPLGASAASTPPKPGDVYPVRPHQVDRLRKDLIEYLYQARNPDGNWEVASDGPEFHGGNTALCVYALLAAGQPASDPRLSKAIDFMLACQPKGTYVVGARISACFYLPWARVKDVVKADQQYLISAQIPPTDPYTKGPAIAAGLYDYGNPPTASRTDHSVSQFAVLGMWLCEQMGLPAPRDYWTTVEHAWVRDQLPDGGWNYNGGTTQATGSMTAAGVATLFITQDYVRLGSGAVLQSNFRNEPLDRGISWLAQNFSADHNPNMMGPGTTHHYYWLYGIERVSLAGGLKYIGQHNWYDEGVRVIAQCDHKDGVRPSGGGHSQVHDAAFALLFLVRGQKPILVNKLRYEGDWNRRPRDIANVCRWFGKRFETDVLWQVLRVDDDVREYRQAPILYITGDAPLIFDGDQKKRLKEYIEDGGLVLFNAEAGEKPFVDSARSLLQELFPQYPIRPLPESHLIKSGVNHLRQPIEILGQSNGIRELGIILPQGDLPQHWLAQTKSASSDALDAAANILLYATDRNHLRVRGDDPFVIRDPAIKAHQQAALARIQYDGNWDPEPGGWRRMQTILHNENEIDLAVETIPLKDLNLEGYQFAHITGTGTVKLSGQNLAEIRRFLIAGGTLVVDAASGSPEFRQSIQGDLDQLVPNLHFGPMALTDAILDDTHPIPEPEPHIFPDDPPQPRTHPTEEHKLEIEYRRFARSNSKEATGLQLQGIRVGRRYAIILSPFDLSAGLTGQSIDGVMGYSASTATEIVRRIIVNSLPKSR